VEQVIEAFEAATGKSVDRPADTLHEEINTRSDTGVGEMMLLSFLLPVGGGEDAATGLERNVRNRFETLDPTSSTQLRDLSRFNEELVADIGVMVAILNASGIGIRPELVHTLGMEYGNDWETHDEIAEIRAALEGWFLYSTRTESAVDVMRTTHRLWSTLYLRELALNHEQRQQNSRRRSRSEKRFARCLNALVGTIDDSDTRDALEEEFPNSPVLERIADDPTEFAEEVVLEIFEIGENWPVLASLYGTTNSARYQFPDSCPESVVLRAKELRGNTHRLRGDTSQARAEYEDVLDMATELEARLIQARSYNHLGLVAEAETDLDTAVEHFEESLEIFRSLQSPRGEAMCLSNLGLVAKKKGDLEAAKEYYERGLERFRDSDGTYVQVACLGNLGVLTQELGELSTARSYLRQSLELSRSINDRQRKAEALLGLGLIARTEGNFETAKEYTERGLEIERELGNRYGEAKALGIQGLIARERGRLQRAREYCDRSVELFETIDDQHGEATILGVLAVIERDSDAHQDAAEAISRGINLFRSLGDKLGVAECRGIGGTIDIARGNTEAGRRKFADSLSDIRNVGARLTELQLVRQHMQVEYEQGNVERVRDLYEEAQSCFTEVEANLGYEQELVEQYYRQVSG
jgi:tetratricopeptide (TPR) repeat protein